MEMPRESLLAIGTLLCGPLPYCSVSCCVSDHVQQRCFQKEKEKKSRSFPEVCYLNFCYIYLMLCWCCYINLLSNTFSYHYWVVEPSTFLTPDSFLECINYFPTCVHGFAVIWGKKKKVEGGGQRKEKKGLILLLV